MRRTLLVCFLCCIHSLAHAAGYVFDYNVNCNRAYQCFLSLRNTDGRNALALEMKSNPYNLMPVYIADYEDCISLLLTCDKADYKLKEKHLDERLAMIENGDHNSPWYRLCKSGIYLHWALINMRMGNLYEEIVYFRKSFMLLKENKQQFPGFEYNQVFSGLQEAVAGSLPSNYKWLAAMFGIKGNIKRGTAQLATFLSAHTTGQPLYAETQLYYLFTRFYLVAEQKEVWDYLAGNQFPTNGNLLNAYVKVSLALDYRKADDAIETLKAASADPNYKSYPIFHYQMGAALLTRGDSTCTYYYYEYLKANKSDIFVKDCWQKMAIAWYIAGNMAKATQCRSQISSRGSERLDADKQAQKFGEGTTWPLRKLMQARLLIEGGYYTQALQLLNSPDMAGINNPADKAEYYFRLGRVYEETGNGNKALEYYQQAITTGKERHEQFAARAALQKGRVYEQAGNPSLAIASYRECLEMPAHDFQNSIDNQAKAGLNRLEGK